MNQLHRLAGFLWPGVHRVGRGHVRSGGQRWCQVSEVPASCRASRALGLGPWIQTTSLQQVLPEVMITFYWEMLKRLQLTAAAAAAPPPNIPNKVLHSIGS